MKIIGDVECYAVKLKDDSISIIANDSKGDQFEMVFCAGDAYDMAGLINELFNDYMDSKCVIK